MEATELAIELTAARWESWIGASQRMHHGASLLAGAPPRRGRRAQPRPRTRSSLPLMLAVTLAGWLLLL